MVQSNDFLAFVLAGIISGLIVTAFLTLRKNKRG